MTHGYAGNPHCDGAERTRGALDSPTLLSRGSGSQGRLPGRRFIPGPRAPQAPCSCGAALPTTQRLPRCCGHSGISCVLLVTFPGIQSTKLCQVHMQHISKLLLHPRLHHRSAAPGLGKVMGTSGLLYPSQARVPASHVVYLPLGSPCPPGLACVPCASVVSSLPLLHPAPPTPFLKAGKAFLGL